MGRKSGWGRMYYEDGSVYEGEWYDDKRHGQGMFRTADENRYEGEWQDDKKHGHGKYYFLDKGQVYEGVWFEDTAKCGEMKDFCRETAPDPSKYPLPQCYLANSQQILLNAEENLAIKDV